MKGFCGAEGRSTSPCVVTAMLLLGDFLPCSRQCIELAVILACVELVRFYSNISVLSSLKVSLI